MYKKNALASTTLKRVRAYFPKVTHFAAIFMINGLCLAVPAFVRSFVLWMVTFVFWRLAIRADHSRGAMPFNFKAACDCVGDMMKSDVADNDERSFANLLIVCSLYLLRHASSIIFTFRAQVCTALSGERDRIDVPLEWQIVTS